MLNENAKKWVAALRSGIYPQGKKSLARKKEVGNFEYCCLGVACEVYAEEHPEFLSRINKENLYARYDDQFAFLPSIVRAWLGLRTPEGAAYSSPSLYQWNDTGSNFNEIADIIESEPEGLFESQS